MTSWVATPRLRSAWYICSELRSGTLKSLSPHKNSVGVAMRSACRKGDESLTHVAGLRQGSPSSASYSRTCWSVPKPARMFDALAPLTAALKRVLSDHVVREDAAVAPAPDAEPARI